MTARMIGQLSKLAGARRFAVLAVFLVLTTPALAGAVPKGIPRLSGWLDSRHGWASHYPGQGPAKLYATDDGGRTWHLAFEGGNYIFFYLRTSQGTGLVEAGNWGGATFWTRDGGRHWYWTKLFPGQDYRFEPRSLVQSGRGSLLFWHQSGDTLYRIEGWPPRGDVPCDEREPLFEQVPGHLICATPPGEAGMRSVVAARLDRGVFGAMRSIEGGVVALVEERNDRKDFSGAVAVYRGGSLLRTTLPDPPPLLNGEKLSDFNLAAAWPRLYVIAPLRWTSNRLKGTVLWRSVDGGRTWTVTVARALPKRVALVRGRARVGTRAWLPGGFVASARAGRRPVLLTRQLGHTRLLALPGSGACSSLEPRIGWPQLFVEGRRSGRTAAVWWSPDGGRLWTRFGRC